MDTLGVVPKYGWHIDPFGLSSSYSIWFKAMNMTVGLLAKFAHPTFGLLQPLWCAQQPRCHPSATSATAHPRGTLDMDKAVPKRVAAKKPL
jgi:hypothetical protein